MWATKNGPKDLVWNEGQKWLYGKKIEACLDVASGTNDELTKLAPKARKYYFLDNCFFPVSANNRILIKQSVEEQWPIKNGRLDLVISNGSFDHFSASAQEYAFNEVERVLSCGGLFLFACEYFVIPNSQFFVNLQNDPEVIEMNCRAFCNINLQKIARKPTKLKLIQKNVNKLPDGNCFLKQKTINAKVFKNKTKDGLEINWGSFFCVFKKVK